METPWAMRILIKFPSRGRPQQFLKTLKGWIDNADDKKNISVLVSFDSDDLTMTKDVLDQAQLIHWPMALLSGDSKTKIAACNANMDQAGEWDVLLLVSDDMHCVRQGWDTIIRHKMQALYPDTDGCLWFHDNSRQRDISTLSCMGRKFFDRFGYVYHPSYASFWCDNEYTDVARSLNKITFIENPIASHEHPAWQAGVKTDALYQRNNRYWAQDKANYYKRKAEGFPK